MATKADLSREINEKLDTNLGFEEMKKDDLELLNELIDGGHLIESLARHLAKEKGSEQYKELVDEWKPGQILAKVI